MADLNAAAKCVVRNESIAYFREILESIKLDLEQDDLSDSMKDELSGIASHLSLAAQALEALAWAENQKQPIECVLGKWRILGRCPDGYLRLYHADTPLGALLAAMEGERDGN